ncbi:AraC family transcriptional regulator [Solwaraspora sp. WMMD406]|uniref:AraC family transcriptional regulator n=1 Tax=Solwaraspora sp. WMMD406 TaxID=3016095 RepID=UPI00241684BF|nr:AraC family transcriptional regulator [Solwaraspora sp. WMMD406]MDG4768094.1 AraC family transcriptional regulator [Solwaraspora sp. WMMD406]
MSDRRFVGSGGLAGLTQAVRESLVPQTIKAHEPAAFRARLRDTEIGHLRLVSAALGPLQAHRTVAPAATGSVFLLLGVNARGEIRHRHGREPITPGHLVVVPSSEGFTVEYPSPSRVLFVVLSEPVVTDRYPLLDGPIRSAPLEPVAAVLVRQLPHLMSAAERAGAVGRSGGPPGSVGRSGGPPGAVGRSGGPPGAVGRSGGRPAEPPGELPAELPGILDGLLQLTLRSTIGETSGQPLPALRVAAERLIEQELARPDRTVPELAVPQLAARLAVSVRQLHRAFEPTGHTVAEYVRLRRLAACAHALRDTSMTVTELAHRYGFASASHLGVLFRARYGTSPGRWRGSDGDPAPR